MGGRSMRYCLVAGTFCWHFSHLHMFSPWPRVSRLKDVQQQVHEVLEGCGDEPAPLAGDVLPHVAPEDLVEGRGLLGVLVQALRLPPGDELALLEALHQVPQELVRVLLAAMGEVLADELQHLVDLDRLL